MIDPTEAALGAVSERTYDILVASWIVGVLLISIGIGLVGILIGWAREYKVGGRK